MELLKTMGGIILAMTSAVLQIPSLDVVSSYLPECLQWGQTASELVKFAYSICGVVMIIFSIKMLKVRIKLKEMDLKLKENKLEDWEDLQVKLKDDN